MFGDADAYEKFMGRWSRRLAPLLIDFAGPPENGRLLDIGSGTGSLSLTLAELKPRSHVTGIDPSKHYIGFAASRNPYPGRVAFETGDAQQLRFPAGAFDSSLSLLVFNFIPDPSKALSEARRATKPRGCVSAAVWDYGNGMRMLRIFWDAVVHVDPPARRADELNMPLCRPGGLKALWQRAGLERVEDRALDISMEFQSFADFWDPFLLGQGPAGAYLKSADAARRQAIRDEVIRRLALKSQSAPFSIPSRAWAVRGYVVPA